MTLLWPDLLHHSHQQAPHYPNERPSLCPVPFLGPSGLEHWPQPCHETTHPTLDSLVFPYPSYYQADPNFSFYSSLSSTSAFNGLCFPDSLFCLSVYSTDSPCFNSLWKWLLNLLLCMSHLSQLHNHEACASTYLAKSLSICVPQPVAAPRYDLVRYDASSTRHLSPLYPRNQITHLQCSTFF